MSDEKGYIKLYRGIRENEVIWEERATRLQAWIDLLLLANYKEKTIVQGYETVAIERGSFITSYPKLGERWGWDKRTVKRFMLLLQDNKMVSLKVDNHGIAVNIVNYCKYQGFLENDVPQNVSQNVPQDVLHHVPRNVPNEERKESIKNEKESKRNNKSPYIPLFEMVDEKPYSGLLKEKLKDWLKYKTEKKQGYKQTGFKTLLGKIDKALNENNEDAIIECFDDAMSHNWSGVFFDKLQGKKKQESFSTDDIMQIFKKEGD